MTAKAKSRSAQSRRWLVVSGIVLAMLALTAAIIWSFRFIEMYLETSLEGFAWAGYLIVFVVTLLSSATIFIPAPSLAIVIAAATQWNPAIVAIVASIGDTLGEFVGYAAGYWGTRIIVTRHVAAYDRAVDWMQRHGMFAIFFFALIPLMLFDLVGLAAGALRVKPWKFFLACWGGRIPRAFFLAYVGYGIPGLIRLWTS
ncbi:MAG: VTT domain-containing protein [Chloroflexi bacterium]|nr:VTT domain-containing protein [Chloroflexota bacterium]MBM3172864.1 VTT domain-containing protein [Chloroflexota bacterium]MBM3174262.1 VTT domain-containing protein [Chloroflexota bacterium]MBM4449513.1 VTT domain-containing protein [Chloroflexota bacterium]